MSLPKYRKATDLKKPLKIGKIYWVQCIKTSPDSGGPKIWIPIYGTIHADEANTGASLDIIGVPHIHVDMRFLDSEELHVMNFSLNDSGAIRVNIPKKMIPNAVMTLKWEPRKCRRQWGAWSGPNLKSPLRKSFEKQYKNCRGCKTCPHQNFDLTTVKATTVDGKKVKICPGHNLAWDAITGELVPRN